MRAAPILALAGLLLAPVGAVAQQISNHDLFVKSLKASQQALQQYGTPDDRAALRRINDIGYRVAAESGFTDFPFTFHLIDMPEPNAFALPGGHIFVTRGMLDLDLDDDMLAGLLGHEVAHVVWRHGTRMQRRATLLNALSQALLVGVMISASNSDQNNPYYDPRDPRAADSGSGDVIEGSYAASVVVTELLLRSYNREFEDEADEEGQRWAAGAGFDPGGTRALMGRMADRIPQTQSYGYWRTHPFYEQRVQAARVRQELLTVRPAEDASDFRARTQNILLWARQQPKIDEDLTNILEWQALNAWPAGEQADRIRIGYLHRARAAMEEQQLLARDFTSVMDLYTERMDEVRELTPESPLLHAAGQEIGEMRVQRKEAYPAFVEIWEEGVYETEFLEVFLSNFPESEHSGTVALALGDAYSRSRRQTDAVEQYLAAWESFPESDAGQRARNGLRNLVEFMSRLAALQQLANQDSDLELQRLASEKLVELSDSYEALDNGAEYLDRFPSGTHADAVARRLDVIANELLGELLLYQTVGDTVKALERIRQILTHAPLSPAAERLRRNAVLEE